MAYFPNSTDGDILQQQCETCPLDLGPCPVVHVQLQFNYDQLKPGNEQLRQAMTMLVNDKGECQVRKKMKLVEPPKESILEYLEKTK